jgi:hypothetical protein
MKSFYTIENVENILLEILYLKIATHLGRSYDNGGNYSDANIDNVYRNIIQEHYNQYVQKYPGYAIPNLNDVAPGIFKNINFRIEPSGQKNLYIEFKFRNGIFSHDYFSGIVLSLHGHSLGQLRELSINSSNEYDGSRFHLHLGGLNFYNDPHFTVNFPPPNLCDTTLGNYEYFVKNTRWKFKIDNNDFQTVEPVDYPLGTKWYETKYYCINPNYYYIGYPGIIIGTNDGYPILGTRGSVDMTNNVNQINKTMNLIGKWFNSFVFDLVNLDMDNLNTINFSNYIRNDKILDNITFRFDPNFSNVKNDNDNKTLIYNKIKWINKMGLYDTDRYTTINELFNLYYQNCPQRKNIEKKIIVLISILLTINLTTNNIMLNNKDCHYYWVLLYKNFPYPSNKEPGEIQLCIPDVRVPAAPNPVPELLAIRAPEHDIRFMQLSDELEINYYCMHLFTKIVIYYIVEKILTHDEGENFGYVGFKNKILINDLSDTYHILKRLKYIKFDNINSIINSNGFNKNDYNVVDKLYLFFYYIIVIKTNITTIETNVKKITDKLNQFKDEGVNDYIEKYITSINNNLKCIQDDVNSENRLDFVKKILTNTKKLLEETKNLLEIIQNTETEKLLETIQNIKTARKRPFGEIGGGNNLYKQKYLKYKQKYLELKKKLGITN